MAFTPRNSFYRMVVPINNSFTAANGANTFFQFGTGPFTSQDPYGMLAGGTTWVCPKAGWYSLHFGWAGSAGTSGYFNPYFYDPSVGLAPAFAQSLYEHPAVATGAWQGTITQVYRAALNAQIAVNVGNVTGGVWSPNQNAGTKSNYLAVCWEDYL